MLQHARKMGFAKAGVYFAHPTRIRRHHRLNIDDGGWGASRLACVEAGVFRTHRNRKHVVLQCLRRSTQWRWTRLCLQFAALGFKAAGEGRIAIRMCWGGRLVGFPHPVCVRPGSLAGVGFPSMGLSRGQLEDNYRTT